VSIISGGVLQQVFDVNAAPRTTPAEAQALLDAVFGGDQEYCRLQSPWSLAERNADAIRKMRIRLIVGDQENVLENNCKFEAHLTRLKIPHAFMSCQASGMARSRVYTRRSARRTSRSIATQCQANRKR
jgi:esterase/lipase superfamily enzyme